MEKLTLIKVGGKIVEDEAALLHLLRDFSKIEGAKTLVHGGGRLATDLSERLGVERKMVDGRRITDEETLRIVTMVYAGLVNKNIVARLQALQVDAVGLTGADMNFMRAEKRPVKTIDYGFVGDVKEVRAEVLTMLLKKGFVPILSPLTHDMKGNLLNTNADTIAGETAKALAASFDVTLIFCFEKNGVLYDEQNNNRVIPHITRAMFEDYKNQGIIRGGMIPKLENSFQAIEAGVKQVIITKASDINNGRGTVISNG